MPGIGRTSLIAVSKMTGIYYLQPHASPAYIMLYNNHYGNANLIYKNNLKKAELFVGSNDYRLYPGTFPMFLPCSQTR